MALTKVTSKATTTISAGWTLFNNVIDDLASTSNAKGASCIGVEDSAGNLDATNVETAIAEIYSDIQTQLDAKAALASPTFTGTVTVPTPFTLGAVSVLPTGTELNFVDGVTSAIQTQLDTKAPLASPTFTGTVTIPTPFTLGAVSVLPTGTELNFVDGVTSAIQTQLNAKAASGANPDITSLRALVYDIQVYNLKPVVNADVNKLDIFTKSGGAVPDASNPIIVSIPDGNGFTNRTRNATYLSGTSQFIMADAADYWSKGSLDAEIKTAYIYAIWDAAGGIVWALGGYSGFTRCPASTTATDDDFFLLEASSTYTKVVTDYCVCVGKIRYQYDTADTPDHTIQATVIDAPQVIWNPKSDYGYQKNLAAEVTSAGEIAEYSALSIVVMQSGSYGAQGQSTGAGGGVLLFRGFLKTGSATYGSAIQKATSRAARISESSFTVKMKQYLNAGDTIHFGISLSADSGTRNIYGDNTGIGVGPTNLTFWRED